MTQFTNVIEVNRAAYRARVGIAASW